MVAIFSIKSVSNISSVTVWSMFMYVSSSVSPNKPHWNPFCLKSQCIHDMKCDDKVCIHEVIPFQENFDYWGSKTYVFCYCISSYLTILYLLKTKSNTKNSELLLLCSKTYRSERFFNENMTLLSLTMCFTAQTT